MEYSVSDLLTPEHASLAMSLMKSSIMRDVLGDHDTEEMKKTSEQLHKDLMEQVVMPNQERIQTVLGDPNFDPEYLAYGLEHCMMKHVLASAIKTTTGAVRQRKVVLEGSSVTILILG